MQINPHRPVVHPRRLLALVTLSLLVATVIAPVTAATSVRRAWAAQLGGTGTNGIATLYAYWGGTGALDLKLVGLKPSTTYPVIAYRGSCANPTIITRLPGAVTDASGAVSKTSAVSTRIMNSIWAYAQTSNFAIKVGNGSLGRCGVARFAVATRIAIPALRIDLPIVRPGSGYPLCKVAMSIPQLSQPGEAGVTLIYAHARTGMFLPLLERSKINNGASLLGRTIQVWTSNDLVATYRIVRVRRHVTTLDGVFAIRPEQLWIQTSEGPRGTVGKLIVIATRVASQVAAHDAANPTPHPVVCR